MQYVKINHEIDDVVKAKIYFSSAINRSMEEYASWSIDIESDTSGFAFQNLHFVVDVPKDLVSTSFVQDDEGELSLHYIFINGNGIKLFDYIRYDFLRWDERKQILQTYIKLHTGDINIEMLVDLAFDGFYFYGYKNTDKEYFLSNLRLSEQDYELIKLPNDSVGCKLSRIYS